MCLARRRMSVMSWPGGRIAAALRHSSRLCVLQSNRTHTMAAVPLSPLPTRWESDLISHSVPHGRVDCCDSYSTWIVAAGLPAHAMPSAAPMLLELRRTSGPGSHLQRIPDPPCTTFSAHSERRPFPHVARAHAACAPTPAIAGRRRQQRNLAA